MRKSTALIVSGIVFAMLLFSGPAYAGGKVGTTTAAVEQPCELRIAEMVAIYVTDGVDIILDPTSLKIPDLMNTRYWPRYMYPTYPDGAPYCELWFWTNNASGANVKVQADRGGWDTLALAPPGDTFRFMIGRLRYAPTGTRKTRDGGEPSSDWKPFSTTNTLVTSGATGAHRYDLDYQFMWKENDVKFEPTVPDDRYVTLTYTVTPGLTF